MNPHELNKQGPCLFGWFENSILFDPFFLEPNSAKGLSVGLVWWFGSLRSPHVLRDCCFFQGTLSLSIPNHQPTQINNNSPLVLQIDGWGFPNKVFPRILQGNRWLGSLGIWCASLFRPTDVDKNKHRAWFVYGVLKWKGWGVVFTRLKIREIGSNRVFFSISLHFRKEDLSICMYLWSKNDSNHLEDGPRIQVTSSKWGEIT